MSQQNKGKKAKKKNHTDSTKRLLVEADDIGQIYGLIIRALGNSFFEVKCFDNKTRRCKVRSKKIKIAVNDLVIISLRDFDNKTGDIIYKYEYHEVLELQKLDKIPKDTGINMKNPEETKEEDMVSFDFENI